MNGSPEKNNLTTSIEAASFSVGYTLVKIRDWPIQMFLTEIYEVKFPDKLPDLTPELSAEYFAKVVLRFGEALERRQEEMKELKGNQKYILKYLDLLNKEYARRQSTAKQAGLMVTDIFSTDRKFAKYIYVTIGGKKMTAENALNLLDKEIEDKQKKIAYLQLQYSRSVFWLRRYLPSDQKDFLPDEVFSEYFKAGIESGKSTFGIN